MTISLKPVGTATLALLMAGYIALNVVAMQVTRASASSQSSNDSQQQSSKQDLEVRMELLSSRAYCVGRGVLFQGNYSGGHSAYMDFIASFRYPGGNLTTISTGPVTGVSPERTSVIMGVYPVLEGWYSIEFSVEGLDSVVDDTANESASVSKKFFAFKCTKT